MESQGAFVTKTDLKEALDAAMHAQDQRSEGRMDVLEQRLIDKFADALRDTETKILQAFYGFAETNNRRLVQGEAATAMVVSRLTTIESRVLEIEKRLNIPPTA
ncbi:MAG TPA: hypothetical protein VLN48_13775 [Bryobacteraceae bacterium]|nr:hypothetical protein [Bryobacteraceae bacterium]